MGIGMRLAARFPDRHKEELTVPADQGPLLGPTAAIPGWTHRIHWF